MPAAVAVRRVFPFHSPFALRAGGETSKAMKEVKAADLHHRHELAEGHLPPNGRGVQQVIWCQIKANAEFSKVRIVGAVLPLAMSPKYLGLRSHHSELRSGFITELVSIA